MNTHTPARSLPVEVWVMILCFVPATRKDPREPTLLSCSQVDSSMRIATIAPVVWQLPYETRYTHSEEDSEQNRRESLRQDWRLMYFERRRLDREALTILDKLREERSERHARVRILARDYSYDIWDALKLECELPVPSYFQMSPDTRPCPAQSLPRRYWAKTVLSVIARRHAVSIWARCIDPDTSHSVSLELALAAYSAFYGVSIVETTSCVSATYAFCKRRLVDEGVILDVNAANYDVWTVCLKLQEVIRELGFRPSPSSTEEDALDFAAYFPHFFMVPGNYQGTPISLVYVFVSVANRLGIDAVPGSTPDLNLILIRHADVTEPPRVIDVRCTGFSDERVSALDICRVLDWVEQKILAALTLLSTGSVTSEIFNAAFQSRLYWICMHAVSVERIFVLLPLAGADQLAVLLDMMSVRWQPRAREIFTVMCNIMLQNDEESAIAMRRRSDHPNLKHSVGATFRHRRTSEIVGCIIGWHPCAPKLRTGINGQPDGGCAFDIPDEDCDKSQPYYMTMATDGRFRYVAEENIVTIDPSEKIITGLFRCSFAFGRYFVDFETAGDTDSGRLVPSKELRDLYPEA